MSNKVKDIDKKPKNTTFSMILQIHFFFIFSKLEFTLLIDSPKS